MAGGSSAAIWWRWWAIAAFAHVVGSPSTDGWSARALANMVVGLVAIAVVARPHDRWLRTALAATIVAGAVAEAPLIGNHWLLAAAVSGVALTGRPWRPAPGESGAVTPPGESGAVTPPSLRRAEMVAFAPAARLMLLVFYAFAAFAKLNHGFFDPVESCARFFANQTLGFWQLPQVPDSGPVPFALAVGSVAIELSVPVLLIIPRTRRYGVWLGVIFHLVLTLDLRQHFYDFTLVLLPLFVLFAPASFLATLDRRLPRPQVAKLWTALAAAQVVAFHAPIDESESGQLIKGLALIGAWGLWLVILAAIVRGLWEVARTGADRPSPSVSLRPPSVVAAVLVGLVALNGLSPYLEVKTATAFNMYANLVTGNGETNHFLVGRTVELRSGQRDTVEILSTDSEELESYIDSGFALPLANLNDFLVDGDATRVQARIVGPPDRADEVVSWAEDEAHDLIRPEKMVWWQERFLLYRAVPLSSPPACQNSWLPAR